MSVHNSLLPNVLTLDLEELKNPSTGYLTRLMFTRLDFRLLESAHVCGHSWVHEARRLERRERCPKCGEFGSGFGTIGNEKRFFHERDRSCYIGVVQNLLKRNPEMQQMW